MWRVVRKRSIDQMITRSFDQGEKADGQNKTMWPKGTGHRNAIRAAVQLCWRWCDIQQSPRLLWTKMGGWQSRYRSRWSDCQTDSRCSKAADESCAYQKGILVQKKSSVIGGRRIFLTKMSCHRRQGYLPKLVTKSMRCPRRLRVPSLNKIAQTEVRPSPLWEFRAANCFRDLIATLQNENPRRTAVV